VTPGHDSLLSDRDAEAVFNGTRGVRPDFQGHYMFNFRVETPVGPAILREPQPGFSGFDARMLQEADALALAATAGVKVPRLLYRGKNYLIEEFIVGASPSFDNWCDWLGELLRQVSLLRNALLPGLVPLTNIYAWQCWMRDFLVDLHAKIAASHGDRLSRIAVPPLAAVWQPDNQAHGRLAMVHADLHPDNLILNRQGIWIIDWELALIADPIWEAATSLHRTRWPDAESEQAAVRLWLDSLGGDIGFDHLESRLASYRAIEVWKSLVVDSVKYPRAIRERPDSAARYTDSFYRKLAQGHSLFDCASVERAEVGILLNEWAGKTQ
jgi:hypothetical protein